MGFLAPVPTLGLGAEASETAGFVSPIPYLRIGANGIVQAGHVGVIPGLPLGGTDVAPPVTGICTNGMYPNYAGGTEQPGLSLYPDWVGCVAVVVPPQPPARQSGAGGHVGYKDDQLHVPFEEEHEIILMVAMAFLEIVE